MEDAFGTIQTHALVAMSAAGGHPQMSPALASGFAEVAEKSSKIWIKKALLTPTSWLRENLVMAIIGATMFAVAAHWALARTVASSWVGRSKDKIQ